MTFQILPAIDLMDGACVRLQQGDANRKTRYEIPPAQVAADYQLNGAQRIHVVDLDGAFSGTPANLEAIKAIRAAAPDVLIEVGGGVRDEKTVNTLLEAGINFVVIGTKALEDLTFLKAAVDAHGDKIIVGADARNGFLSAKGWTQDTNLQAVPYIKKLREEIGISTVIYTDIARDGMFTSPNIEDYKALLEIDGLNVIASGGVGEIDHLLTLKALGNPRLLGVIVGKAIYDGRITLKEAVAALS